MLMSMTGFGKAQGATESKKIMVEIKSLNSKQMDMNVRVPFAFREHELEVRNLISRTLERGKVDVTITMEDISNESAETTSTVNVGALMQYKRQISEAATAMGVAEPTDWFSLLLRMPDAIKAATPEAADEALVEVLHNTSTSAVEQLMNHRRAEGVELEKFFSVRINAIGELLQSVSKYENERLDRIRTRMEEGLAKIPVAEYDKGRLEQEMIFYIEKLDVAEEKQRLGKHLAYFMETMDAPAAGQGKKLGFIAQEMGREINTLGSKSNHAEMQAIVVRMKDLLEQIKEQVLNVM